jgi:hypothetical protein
MAGRSSYLLMIDQVKMATRAHWPMQPNQSTERTRTGRSGCRVIVSPWRLTWTAHADRNAAPHTHDYKAPSHPDARRGFAILQTAVDEHRARADEELAPRD